MKKYYEVSVYVRYYVIDKNNKLVLRWRLLYKEFYTNKKYAVKFFTEVNKGISCLELKAVLRLKKGGKKRGKR